MKYRKTGDGPGHELLTENADASFAEVAVSVHRNAKILKCYLGRRVKVAVPRRRL